MHSSAAISVFKLLLHLLGRGAGVCTFSWCILDTPRWGITDPLLQLLPSKKTATLDFPRTILPWDGAGVFILVQHGCHNTFDLYNGSTLIYYHKGST